MTSPVFRSDQDREDGLDLRHLTFGGVEIASRLYFAVRDPLWRTVPVRVVARERRDGGEGLALHYSIVSTDTALPFTASIAIDARGEVLTASAVLTALAELDYCRIGFCLLLDADAQAGLTGTSVADGRATGFRFPTNVVTRGQRDAEAEAFHASFDRARFAVPGGGELELRSRGSRLEFEDQRNWTDTTLKAYAVSDGWPHHARTGDVVRHSLELGVVRAPSPPAADSRTVTWGGAVATMPPVVVFDPDAAAASYRPAGGFHDLNCDRPALPAGTTIDLPLNGAVHADDDESIMEATAMHGVLVRQARALYPQARVVVSPASFEDVAGDWRGGAGEYVPEPPFPGRHARLSTPLAAAWAVASVASAAPAGPAAIRLFRRELPLASEAASTVALLGALEGLPVLAVTAPRGIAALAVRDGAAVVLALVNRTPSPLTVDVPGRGEVELGAYAVRWCEIAEAPAATDAMSASR